MTTNAKLALGAAVAVGAIVGVVVLLERRSRIDPKFVDDAFALGDSIAAGATVPWNKRPRGIVTEGDPEEFTVTESTFARPAWGIVARSERKV